MKKLNLRNSGVVLLTVAVLLLMQIIVNIHHYPSYADFLTALAKLQPITAESEAAAKVMYDALTSPVFVFSMYVIGLLSKVFIYTGLLRLTLRYDEKELPIEERTSYYTTLQLVIPSLYAHGIGYGIRALLLLFMPIPNILKLVINLGISIGFTLLTMYHFQQQGIPFKRSKIMLYSILGLIIIMTIVG